MKDYIPEKKLIEMINNPSADLKQRALVSFLYLTACRVSECVGRIKKSQIEFTTIENQPFLFINDVLIEKRRKLVHRDIPININDDKAFVDVFLEYIDYLNPDEILFDMSRVNAFYIVRNITGKSPHNLRHSRITILRTVFGMSIDEVTQFVGWGNWRSAEDYVHLGVMDVALKLKRKRPIS